MGYRPKRADGRGVSCSLHMHVQSHVIHSGQKAGVTQVSVVRYLYTMGYNSALKESSDTCFHVLQP